MTGAEQRVATGPGVAQRPGGSLRWLLSARFCWVLAGAALLLTLTSAGIMIAGGDLFLLPFVPTAPVAALMGGLVASRRPGHLMGVLLAGYGFTGAVAVLADAYALAAVVNFPGDLPFATQAMWTTAWTFAPPVALTLVLPLVFPDGRLLSARWRAALWATAAFTVLALAGNAFAPESMGAWFSNRPNPYAVPGPVFGLLLDAAGVCALVTAVAGMASVAQRWRRAGHVERQQLKWLVAIIPLNVAVIVIVQFFPDATALGIACGAATDLVLAVGLGLAVLRYRLYGIDVLVSRAVVYGLLTVAVAGVYLAAVAVAGERFAPRRGLSVPVLVTVLAATVLLPVREQLQRRVDRVFFGDRGAPYVAMARLGRQVEDAADTEPVLASLAAVVAASLRLPYVAVELRVGEEWVPAAASGRPPAEPADVECFPLMFQREAVGRLMTGRRAPGEKLSPDDERLLGNLARQVAPAAHAVALRQALEASRARLVTAREEERRRLRRDLHDGLGPALAGLTLGLDAARSLATGQCELDDLLTRLKAETRQALEDVRHIAYGLRPPALDQLGLEGALREEITRTERQAAGLTVTLSLSGPELPALPAAVEVAAYRIIIEAVTNVARHAAARSCRVSVTASGRDLLLEVDDDGTGMPEGWRAGVGITSMRERAAELGGRLAIEALAPHGTRITAQLPLDGPR
jgi:signal transduction histidine kinase